MMRNTRTLRPLPVQPGGSRLADRNETKIRVVEANGRTANGMERTNLRMGNTRFRSGKRATAMLLASTAGMVAAAAMVLLWPS